MEPSDPSSCPYLVDTSFCIDSTVFRGALCGAMISAPLQGEAGKFYLTHAGSNAPRYRMQANAPVSSHSHFYRSNGHCIDFKKYSMKGLTCDRKPRNLTDVTMPFQWLANVVIVVCQHCNHGHVGLHCSRRDSSSSLSQGSQNQHAGARDISLFDH